MRATVLTDAEFAAAWKRAGGSPRVMAQQTGISERAIYARRARMDARDLHLPSIPTGPGGVRVYTPEARAYVHRAPLSVTDGVVIVFSDAHWWPGQEISAAHHALLAMVERLNPAAIIANGDIMDLPGISRHDPNGWENTPPVMAELETCQVHMAAIAERAPGAKLLRTIGNHDKRFDSYLAVRVPDYKHLAGMMLRDHLPDWAESMSIEINGAVIVKHRWHQGVHAGHNNVLKAGRTIVTGHLHRLLATPYADYNGRRWGVDTGTLSDPERQQFDYSEDAPKNWGSGFAVLTFRRGALLPPEFCEVIRGTAYFRGEVVHEQKRTGRRAGLRSGGSQAKRRGDVPAGVGRGRPDARADAPAKRGAAARRGAAAE
jgi:hypothetical protein